MCLKFDMNDINMKIHAKSLLVVLGACLLLQPQFLEAASPSHDSEQTSHGLLRAFSNRESLGSDAQYVSATVATQSAGGKKCKIQKGVDKHADAYGGWDDAIDTTGWGYLSVKTGSSSTASSEDKAYAAGCVEGYLTPTRMEQYWGNYALNEYGHHGPSVKLIEFIQQQKHFVESQISRRQKNPTEFDESDGKFWDTMALILAQFNGLCDGYTQGSISPIPMTNLEIYLLNSVGDMEDLNKVFPRKDANESSSNDVGTTPAPKWSEMTDCSGLIKVLPDNSDVVVGHTTWRDYYAMLRSYKKYEFDFMHNGEISMSSSPGFLHSKDDFYVVPGMAVMETTNSIFNRTLYNRLTPSCALSWQRAAIGVWQAATPKEFTSLFAQYNSGTYNNQWMAIQLSQFSPGNPIPDSDIFWIIEQIPGYTKSGDVSAVLKKQGYWPSYNIPYFKEIYNMSGYQEAYKKYGNDFSYEHCPRANIFRRNSTQLSSFGNLQSMMRYNHYAIDPLSHDNPLKSVASRGDLSDIPVAFGGIDSKVVSYNSIQQGKLRVKAISGPTAVSQPAFSFTKSDNGTFSDVPRAGVPDTWNFDWVETTTQLPAL